MTWQDPSGNGAEAVHRGSRVVTAEGRLLDGEGRLLAHGDTSCLLTPVAT